MNENYPNDYFEDKSAGFTWLNEATDRIIKIFIKRYLTTGSRKPFPDIIRDDRYPCHALAELVFSSNNLYLEEKIRDLIDELVSEFDSEYEKASLYNRDEYFYNLFGAATIFRSHNNTFSILYDHSMNNINYLVKKEVYKENLYCFVLSCLFSYNIPKYYTNKIVRLCELNIESSLCSPLCYREAYEIDCSNAIRLMGKYLISVRGKTRFYRFAPLELFFENPLMSGIFDDHRIRKIFLNDVLFRILDERIELEKLGIKFRFLVYIGSDAFYATFTGKDINFYKKLNEIAYQVTLAGITRTYKDTIPEGLFTKHRETILEIVDADKEEANKKDGYESEMKAFEINSDQVLLGD